MADPAHGGVEVAAVAGPSGKGHASVPETGTGGEGGVIRGLLAKNSAISPFSGRSQWRGDCRERIVSVPLAPRGTVSEVSLRRREEDYGYPEKSG